MELADSLSFSLHPREVVVADAQRWRRAMTFSLALHALALGAVVQRHLVPPDAPAALLPLSVLLLGSASAPAAVPSAATIEKPPRLDPVPEYREPSTLSATEVLRAPVGSTFAAPVAAVVAPPTDAAPSQMTANAVATPPAPLHQVPATPDAAALAGYGRTLAAAVDRHKRYPRIALLRQWQGTVLLQLNIGADGRVQEHRLAHSSGYQALDQQALEMLREAMPLPMAPAQLAGVDLSIDIPVIFRIAD